MRTIRVTCSCTGGGAALDAVPHVEGKREDGMYGYRLKNSTQISVGQGRLEWFLKTLNGSIYTRRRS